MSLNRACMYGESVFTTMRMAGGELKDWDLHFDRLKKGVEFVYGPFTDGDGWVAIFKNLLEAKIQTCTGDNVIRFTIYREQARATIRSSVSSICDLSIHLTTTAIAPGSLGVEDRMLRLRTCPAPQKPLWWPSYLKSGNYLETILTQKIYLKGNDDDLIFLDQDDTVLESSVANLFIVKNDRLYTPPLGPGVLDGVMRRKVILNGDKYFKSCEELRIPLDKLFSADAIFCSNSVRGLFLVDRIDDYEISYHQEFLNKFQSLKDKVLE